MEFTHIFYPLYYKILARTTGTKHQNYWDKSQNYWDICPSSYTAKICPAQNVQ